ncbi:Holliday junction ATP-dependent DNA helicase RuvA [Bombiscardovia nodaiensis]|uniref:Holliday junction branch migration complex subunit RuvA n=1 Tax=Bombiscardovia nodaiensis TaxID=2932181 RepID=A0ABM8B8Z4_9BIFI|nr:Holliday junction ATP-dependent DNA helicase RuvA [Bombiscardovia nodaiensis]
MLATLTGSVEEVEPGLAVINVAGVGYEVRMPSSDLGALKPGNRTQVFTYLNLTQDAITLYGFLTKASKALFVQLQKVSGIGPRVALSLLSTLSPTALAQAVAQGDAAALARAPGLGKKGAQKIILELSGKVDVQRMLGSDADQQLDQGSTQVIEGLISLGWQEKDAQEAVKQVCEQGSYALPLSKEDVPLVLKASLTQLDRRR